ncbi:MAG TPA: flavin-dependent oxidoreductase [Jiangellaceae bacterium]
MKPGTGRPVLVVGAGIGGLTAALSLHAAGVECSVVDAARRLTAAGVGINLQPHAVRELTELGLSDELVALGVATTELVHFDRNGNQIWAEPRGRAAGYRWPQYSVHRGELQMMLLREVRARLGAEAVVTARSFEDCVQTADGVQVQLRDRNTGESVEQDVGALIGADGLHSAVRAHLHPGEGPPIGSGIRMWRGTAVRPPFLTGESMIMAGSNTWAKFVAYPISPIDDGLVTVNWVAEVRLPDGDLKADWNARSRPAEVLRHFADWDFGWLDIPELIQRSAEILEFPMVDRDPLPWWGSGRITLLGDAAHPMYPIGSNGGSQAILDARVLAFHLATAPDVPAGLAGYERDRREVTEAIVLANRDLGPERVLRIVAERAPGGFAHISEVLSPEEQAVIGDSYRRTTGTDADTLNARDSWDVPAWPTRAFVEHS